MNIDINIPILKSVSSDQTYRLEQRASAETVKIQSAEAQQPVNTQNIDDAIKQQQAEESAKEQEVDAVVTDLNKVAQDLQRDLLFSVDENSGGTIVKVVDKETDEVIREIPSKEIREIKARLEEAVGLIFQESV